MTLANEVWCWEHHDIRLLLGKQYWGITSNHNCNDLLGDITLIINMGPKHFHSLYVLYDVPSHITNLLMFQISFFT